MIGAIYLSLYGLLTLTSIFLVFAWTRMSWRRGRVIKGVRRKYRDRYMILATGLAINSGGTALLFGTRLLTTLVGGAQANLFTETWALMIAFGMSTILIAKYGFMWAIEIDRRDRWWNLLLALSVMWVLYAFWFEMWYVQDPYYYLSMLTTKGNVYVTTH